MAFPVKRKRRPWTLMVWLVGVAPSAPWAAATDWNCTRSADDKQWVCSNKPSGAAKTGSGEAPRETPAEDARTEPSVESTPPRRETARPVEPAEVPARAGTPPPAEAEAPARPEVAATPRASRPPTAAAPSAAEFRRPPEAAQPRAAQAGPAAPAQRPGWTCRPGEADEIGKGWDCSLAGTDPKGMTRVVGGGVLSPEEQTDAATITHEDEQRFQTMASLLPADPWKNVCTGGRRPPPVSEFVVTARDRQARESALLEIDSDHFEMLDGEVANFRGSAKLVKADQKLWADFVTRNTRTNAANANGRVIYQEKGFSVSGDTGFMDMDTDRGVFRNSQFILASVPARGTSRVTHLDSSTLSRYETFTYTSCPPGDQDWLLHASSVKIDKETGIGTAQNAWMEFKDVPIFYTPYMSFPVDDRRLSGFLSPSFGVTRLGGYNFMAPYYFNLAPNYDYTAAPRYLTERGLQLNNEFRYLTETSRGRIVANIVPDDIGASQTNAKIDEQNSKAKQANPLALELPHVSTVRGQAALLNDTRFGENLIAHVDANYVSDHRYLNEFGSPLNLIDRRNIHSIGYLSYSGSNYNLRTQADYFQTIDPTILPEFRPYFRLPQVAFNYYNGIAETGLQFDGQIQFDAFETADRLTTGQSSAKTTGQRLKLRPRISYPFQSAAGFVTPSFTLMHNEYQLQDPEAWFDFVEKYTGSTIAGGPRTSESLTAPIFSLDSGAFFDREFELADTPMLQTLEPRLFYVYIPTQKQGSIPVFDSSPYDFTFYQLFRENRFTGSDRIGDANQLTAAITSRFIDQSSGLERFRASLGNIFYFQNREVTLYNNLDCRDEQYQFRPECRNNSNVVADLYLGLTQDWSLRAGGQWNPDRNQLDKQGQPDHRGRIDRGLVALQYNNRKNQILNLAYRYRRNQAGVDCVQGDLFNPCLDLTDVSFRLPFAQGWHVIGRWQYSLLDQLTVEGFLGLERETCCWRFTLLGRHYINNFQTTAAQNQGNNGIFLQLELKGLTALGDQVDQFLQREISGYRYRDDY